VTYRWLDDLGDALEAAGIAYVEVGYSSLDPTGAAGWWERGRPASTGQFDPAGVLCHHTASPAGTSDQADLNCILAGNSSAPGPISQLYIGRSATVYLVAAGRANHGGGGIRPGVDDDCTDMNACLVGIEVGNAGTGERWSDPVCTVYADVVAALCTHYGWDVGADVYLHATTGPPYGGCNSKIDPAGPWTMEPDLVGSTTWDLDIWRAFCAADNGDAPAPAHPEGRRTAMADFVVIYGMADTDYHVADGTVLELIAGTKRHVPGDEWWQVLKGVVAGPDGVVPPHDPWQPVAAFTNPWHALALPDHNPGGAR